MADIMYQRLLKPLLFLLPPETAHRLTLGLLHLSLAIPGIPVLFRRMFLVEHPSLRRELWGLTFRNPVGLAAGFDKDGRHYRDMAALGFGFVEIGTVTPSGQPGNPRPRLFRLPADQALINRMGFNNDGVGALVRRLRSTPRPEGLVIGGNIGKNKTTPNADALSDYLTCFEALYPYVDYFVVNVSSPNTPGLRELQEKAPLTALLQGLQSANRRTPRPKPVLLKIAPDLTEAQLDDILEIVRDTGLAGLIATNTTISRENLASPAGLALETGGLSGKPLRDRPTEVVRYLHRRSGGKLPIVAVGGINSARDAMEKLSAGASLVQVYSGLVYEGPGLVSSINKGLADLVSA